MYSKCLNKIDLELYRVALKNAFVCLRSDQDDLCLLGFGFPWEKDSLDVGEDSTLCDGDS